MPAQRARQTRRTRRRWTVKGGGQFPVDMLRYDCCWPASPDGVHAIEVSSRPGFEYAQLTLESDACDPTVERWASFGWTVVPGSLVRV